MFDRAVVNERHDSHFWLYIDLKHCSTTHKVVLPTLCSALIWPPNASKRFFVMQ